MLNDFQLALKFDIGYNQVNTKLKVPKCDKKHI